ncbi:MAG: hypothetical protein N4J56_001781 [Chroococcidiopsis sp. SAG 2025]|nr:hypothetical protein [Chroococcidiopsis sp. SAG 2025]
MPMLNTLKEFIESRPGLTAYQVHKLTRLPQNTIYRLVNDPKVIPSGAVMDAFFNAFPDATPNDLLRHVKDNAS